LIVDPVELQQQSDRLQLRFQLHFADHVRLTRDLKQLQQLVAASQTLLDEIARQIDLDRTPAWEKLLLVVQRRQKTYVEAQGAIAQAQSVAGLRDLAASQLTSRGRLILHRYVRHFAGRSRKTRDLVLLRAIIDDLLLLWRPLEPMLPRIQVPSVAEEIDALGQFLGFFHAELQEIRTGQQSGSRLDQIAAFAVRQTELQSRWQTHWTQVSENIRRIQVLQQLVASLDALLEAMMTIRHANLPDSFETAIAQVARELVRWQDALAAATAARHLQEPSQLHRLLVQQSSALFSQYRQQLSGEIGSRNRAVLLQLCDQMDDVEQGLQALVGQLDVAEDLVFIRDVLVAAGRTYDQVNAAQSEP